MGRGDHSDDRRDRGLVIDFALTPRGFPITRLFVFALWSGWVATALVAEVWILWTRTKEAPPAETSRRRVTAITPALLKSH